MSYGTEIAGTGGGEPAGRPVPERRRPPPRDPPRVAADYPAPDWILLGIPRPGGGFRLIACKDILRAELGVSFERAMDWDRPDGQARIELAARMGSTLFIDRDTYGEALAEMARIWRNWENDGRELT